MRTTIKHPKEQDLLVVEHAYLHQAIGIPGTPLGMEKTLSPIKIPGIKLGWSTRMQALVIRIKGKTALIPAANVASCILHTADIKDGEDAYGETEEAPDRSA